MAKYVVIVGGCWSGSGKGCATASLALLMRMRNLNTTYIKCDGYLNVNAGTLSPNHHGEVRVAPDGTETDLDLGTIERIAGLDLNYKNILTGGTLYKELLEEEEAGKYLGECIQSIPHLTNKIIERCISLGQDQDIVFVEVGGSCGDLESAVFLEAIRQFKQNNYNDVIICLVSPIVFVNTIQEFKTKPLQNSVKTLQSFGLQPDMILCRTPGVPLLPIEILDKVANLTNIPRNAVFEAPDVECIYQVPIEFWKRNIDDLICDRFHFPRNGVKIHKYKELVEKYINADDLPSIEIGVVGKYANADEAYISIKESLYHSGLANNVRVHRHWINAEELEGCNIRGLKKHLGNLDAVIIPGGFDSRGVEGKIKAVRYCREFKIPILGICLGLQCMVIDYARSLCNLENANSIEFDPQTPNPVIHFVEGQEHIRKKSGTMRLGSFSCEIYPDTLAAEVYKKKMISERHRHRYEVNAAYVEQLDNQGFHVSGVNPETGLVEIMELSKDIHPYFIGIQAHPEFQSTLSSPHPLFVGLIKAAIVKSNQGTT